MLKLFLLLLMGVGVWFGLIRRPTARGQFNLPVGVVETLEPQLEALQLAVEQETADHIIESLRLEFSAVLVRRGVPPDQYELDLPAPGEVGAVWVEHEDGRRWTLSDFDSYLDRLGGIP